MKSLFAERTLQPAALLQWGRGKNEKKEHTPCQASAFDNLPWNKALRGNQLIFDARIISNVFKPLIKGHVTEFSSPTSQSMRKEEMQSTSFGQIAPHLCQHAISSYLTTLYRFPPFSNEHYGINNGGCSSSSNAKSSSTIIFFSPCSKSPLSTSFDLIYLGLFKNQYPIDTSTCNSSIHQSLGKRLGYNIFSNLNDIDPLSIVAESIIIRFWLDKCLD